MNSIWQNIIESQPPIDSAVDFPTHSRFHMALNVKDVDRLVPFYKAFFGKPPTLVRDGYAKFELTDPPLNISLNRVPHNARGHGTFGMRVSEQSLVQAMYERLSTAHLQPVATQTGDGVALFHVTDPEANTWKIGAAS
jgi:hypothetical protein